MQTNPYLIEGPALVSFSGGRTSAYMLRHVLDAWEGSLPDDVFVVFADTHKERPETYEFVDDCAREWGVEIHRVERPGGFEQLITDKNYLPNPVTRFCTTELKIRPMRDFMRERGFEHWDNVVGIRADEARRARKLLAGEHKQRWDHVFPMLEAGVTEDDVMAFWRRQSFDLQLRQHEGNCDLCFLKGTDKRLAILSERPDLADWWIEQEERIGAQFRSGRWSYRRLKVVGQEMSKQCPLFPEGAGDDALGDCICGD